MEQDEHVLGLKVMRLTRPTFASSIPITNDRKDLPGNLFNLALQQDPTTTPGLETINLGQFLLLPQNTVNIYLGETFSSYICVFNETEKVVKNVSVKVDLQNNSSRIPLSSVPPTPQLNSNDTVDVIIHHEVKEIGTHILMCEVTYHNTLGTPVSFRKFFKIEVAAPLDLKTKFYNSESDDVYLEAQVQNTTAGPIYLEKVTLDASQLFNVTSLNETADGKSVFGKLIFLQPQSTCQFLYCFTPQPELTSDLKQLSEATNIGKLDIVWRSNLGERGRIQTSPLQRMSPEFDDIRLSIQSIPNFVVLYEVFTFTCKLVNNCDRTVELHVTLEATSKLTWFGNACYKLDALAPRSVTEIEFKGIPLVTGLIPVSGIRFRDTFLKRTYSFDNLAHVYVFSGGDSDKVTCV